VGSPQLNRTENEERQFPIESALLPIAVKDMSQESKYCARMRHHLRTLPQTMCIPRASV
jgi:hypothetical protein